jgi:hypothetical protein
VVTGNRPWVTEARLEKKVERINQRGMGACGYMKEPNMSDISDRSDMFDRIEIYPKNSDLANFLQKSDLSRIYPI